MRIAMIIRQAMLLAVGCIGMALYASGQVPDSAQRTVPMAYELYSWQENGGWNFSVVPSPSGVNVPAEEVFNKKFLLSGVKDLRRKLSTLPEGATIFWPVRISGADQDAKGSQRLRYPSSETVEAIRKYAEARKIKAEMLSAQQ